MTVGSWTSPAVALLRPIHRMMLESASLTEPLLPFFWK